MTVSSGYAPNSSTGNGVTTVFPYNFRILAAADLEVTVDGVVKTLTTDYSVSGVGSGSGGNVTFIVAPAAATTVIRRRNMALVRATDYQDNGDLLADVLNPDQDAPVMMAQQLQEQVNRSLKWPLGDTTSATMPTAAQRAGGSLAFDSSGNPIGGPPLGSLVAEVAIATAAATTATTQAGIATTQAGLATTARTGAETAQGAAQTARDAALAAAKIYASTAAGLAGVASGQYFYVPSTVSTESLILYLNNAGVANEVKRFSANVWTARDLPDYMFAIGSGTRVLVGVRYNGTLDLAPINTPLKDHAERHGGRRFPSQLIHINGAGQSNAAGLSTALTTTQEYDNLTFLQTSTSPTVLYKLLRLDGEDPTMGMASAIKQLLLEEDGLTYAVNDFQLCMTNNGVPANTIDQLSEGGTSGSYEAAVSQVTSGQTVASGLLKTWSSGGLTWTQGEADAGMAEATYKSKLTAFAENYNTDVKAVTGQAWDVPLITWQVGSNVDKSVAVAQWKAALEHPLVFLACPAYFFPYADFQHLTNVGGRWLGGYYGLAWKRIVVDRVGWEPLQPSAVQIVGSNIDVYFNKDGLTLDTTLMPAQTNSGFSVENASAVAQTISSVTVMPGNRVRLAISGTPVAGWKVKYGHNTVTGKANYTVGGGGNLRDTQMWTFKGNTMHNWCVIFDWTV